MSVLLFTCACRRWYPLEIPVRLSPTAFRFGSHCIVRGLGGRRVKKQGKKDSLACFEKVDREILCK
jgi:hypothetical protein